MTTYQKITDFGLDDDGDEYADSTGLAMTGDLPGIKQQVTLRLGFFKGEWFMNEDTGIPWYEEIIVKNPNLIRIREIFRDAILSVTGIREVTFMDLLFSTYARTLSVQFRASTDLGELGINLAGLPNA
jgi:hypothetical protein